MELKRGILDEEEEYDESINGSLQYRKIQNSTEEKTKDRRVWDGLVEKIKKTVRPTKLYIHFYPYN